MKVKNIVKVMNFHSLLRVEKARRKADQYIETEEQLTQMIAEIIYNKNLILDKKVFHVPSSAPTLNIYLGNDYGFCGNFNVAINEAIREDKGADKIIVGKKSFYCDDRILLSIAKDEFDQEFKKIEQLIYQAAEERKYREIWIVYIQYLSISNLQFTRKKIFPIEFDPPTERLNEDFVVETDVDRMLTNLVALYLCYEIRMRETNSWASENIMRQTVTKESLKKIDEREEEQKKVTRKIKKQKAFRKIIENYRRK